MEKEGLRFMHPIDGDMLHANDGMLLDGVLHTTVTIAAPLNSRIKINGVEAQQKNGLFIAELRLKNYKNQIVAIDEISGEKQTITVYRLKRFTDKYRLSIDDNIWFLQDIAVHVEEYTSIFDNSYLGFLKKVNEQYGTKIHINIFYQSEGFNLTQLTDRFKNEWIDNASWLRLSFHALQEKPDKPYLHAGYDEVKKDCELVMDQIRRFAGSELLGPVTTLHWGEATIEGSRALRDAGYAGQLGYFNVDDDLPPVSYYLNIEKRRHLKNRFIWKDNLEDIVFIRSSIVIDTKKKEEIIPHLDAYQKKGNRPPYVDLLVHEQYYYPFYEAYQPDFCEKILTAVKWADDNGYMPAFLSECIFEE